jgi:putative CocE/NonD family hydrolase
MMGNSWGAMSQWYIAAERPPHLTCIAPWEGTSDIYREFMCWGGIPEVGFNEWLLGDQMAIGPGYAEDYVNMARKYPLMNAYWDDKLPQFDKIEIPVYATAGWCHFHLRGATEAFQGVSSKNKWLRCHRDFEWIDNFYPENLADLQLYFDHYLKGIPNSWPLTPRVRIDVMDAGEIDYQHWRPEKEFPLARTQYEKLFLDAKTGQMTRSPVATESSVSYDAKVNHEVQPVSYDAMKGHMANFTMTFDEDTELTGYLKLKLWVEAEGADDMDLFVTVQKLDEKGNQMPIKYQAGDSVYYAHPGLPGKLRVSLRELDEKRSKEYKPYRNYRHPQPLKSKEIVPVDVEVWPTSIMWHAGQQIRTVVSGYYFREKGWWEAAAFTWETINRGKHIIHTGGKYDSHLLVPTIPPKYKTRTYTYR